MRPIDVKLSIYIDFGVENDDKYHEFENGDQAKISKYNKIWKYKISFSYFDL